MQNRNYITVSELNFYLNRIIDAEELLHDIYLMGEVSGVSVVKGNLYCTLKDEGAAIQVCCFGVDKTYLPETGERVIMFGTPDYYMKTGKMSFVAKRIEPFGRGKLFLELETLRKKLEAEGLFGEAHKKPMPRFVFDLAVVTSRGGAVIKDICSTVRKYNKVVNITLIDTSVQGKNAEFEIRDALKLADLGGFDAVILARGGGSYEDLMPFNSETVVRALYEMNTFVISAVGHETDFTLADFAADMRSLTPTAAAEAVTFDAEQLKRDIVSDISYAGKSVKNRIMRLGADILGLTGRITFASSKTISRLSAEVAALLSEARLKTGKLIDSKSRLTENELSKLNALNPVKLLKAGYMRAEADGRPVCAPEDIAPGGKLRLYASFGHLTVTVDDIVINNRGEK